MSLRIRIHIRTMVDMRARMFLFPLDGVGEATVIITIITTAITAAFAMVGIRGGGGEGASVLQKL
jgi:hypothetical protein